MIFGIPAWLFWLIIMIVALVVEALTFNMTTIWFAAGSLAAMIIALFGQPVWLQIVVMTVLSILLLLGFIVLVKPRLNSGGISGTVATNADRIIGSEGIVVVGIDPVAGSGQVKVNGQTWSAVSASGVLIEIGVRVRVKSIQGVKAVVEPVEAQKL